MGLREYRQSARRKKVIRWDKTGFTHIRKLLIRASLNLIPRCLDKTSKLRCLEYVQKLALASDEEITADIFAEKNNFKKFLQGDLTADTYLAGGSPSRNMTATYVIH